MEVLSFISFGPKCDKFTDCRNGLKVVSDALFSLITYSDFQSRDTSSETAERSEK